MGCLPDETVKPQAIAWGFIVLEDACLLMRKNNKTRTSEARGFTVSVTPFRISAANPIFPTFSKKGSHFI